MRSASRYVSPNTQRHRHTDYRHHRCFSPSGPQPRHTETRSRSTGNGRPNPFRKQNRSSIRFTDSPIRRRNEHESIRQRPRYHTSKGTPQVQHSNRTATSTGRSRGRSRTRDERNKRNSLGRSRSRMCGERNRGQRRSLERPSPRPSPRTSPRTSPRLSPRPSFRTSPRPTPRPTPRPNPRPRPRPNYDSPERTHKPLDYRSTNQPGRRVVERCSNDRFQDNNRPRRSTDFGERKGLGVRPNDRNNFEENIVNTRRVKREEVDMERTKLVWGKSPIRQKKYVSKMYFTWQHTAQPINSIN